MNDSAPAPRRLEQLFQNLEDGCISGADHAELMELLRSDPAARRAYLAHMRFASLLHAKAEALAELQGVQPMDEETPPSRQFFRATLAAAAVIALAAYLATFFILPGPPAASVTAGPNTIWNFTHGGIDEEGEFVPGTTLAVEAGTLDLQLTSGSRLLLEGPARLVLENAGEAWMPHGRLWVRAEREGFTVHTKRLKIVDLGTEFGVFASERLQEEVHVAKGRVRVTPRMQTLPSFELTSAQAARADIVGRLRPTPFDPSGFQTELPKAAPFIHWSFDFVDDLEFPSSGDGLAPASLVAFSLEQRKEPLRVAPAPGRFGNALVLDQPGQFAQADFPGISGDLPRTVAFWIKGAPVISENGTALVCWGRAGESGQKWVLHVSGDGSQISTGWGGPWAKSAVAPVAGSVLDNTWHHLAFVFNGQVDSGGRPGIIHYVDGQPLEVRNPSRTHPVDTDCSPRYSWPLTLGTQLFTTPQRPTFNGALDELFVFRTALRQSQVRYLMKHNTLPGETADLQTVPNTETK